MGCVVPTPGDQVGRGADRALNATWPLYWGSGEPLSRQLSWMTVHVGEDIGK